MKRIAIQPRENLQAIANEYGFEFTVVDDKVYWDESAYYQFNLKQIEDHIEDPTNELHGMLLQVAHKVICSEELLTKLGIPARQWDLIRDSWHNDDPSIYGRLDLAYDGVNPVKLYEANYDTPTSLFEASVFQWDWMKEMQDKGAFGRKFMRAIKADQFNSIHERLIAAWDGVAQHYDTHELHLACSTANVEDKFTTLYMASTAAQAGLHTTLMDLSEIGIGTKKFDGAKCFTDMQDNAIGLLFKLYPYEQMFRDPFAAHLRSAGMGMVEPSWKSVISNKGILPLLWKEYEGHPNLLEAHFGEAETAVTEGWVKKAFFSREGANIEYNDGAGVKVTSDEEEPAGGYVIQKMHQLPCFDGNYPVIGSWVIGGEAAGIGIREDNTIITKNTSRFVPHVFID
jgi:glutathionylspermidine synthase